VQEVAAEVAGIHAATVTTNSNSKNRQGGDRDIGDERRKKKKKEGKKKEAWAVFSDRGEQGRTGSDRG